MRVQPARPFAAIAVAAALVLGSVGLAPAATAAAPSTAPVQTGPTNGGDVGSNPVLSWEAVSGASLYRVQVSVSSSFSPVAYTVDTANLNATPPTELANQTFYWRVAAGDAAKAYGPWSQTWTFNKGSGSAPDGLSPDDGTVFAYPDQAPVLQWSPIPGVKTYKLQIDDDSGFLSPIVAPSTANTAYAVTANLTVGKPYYWRVWGVTSGAQETAKTTPRSFSVTWPGSAPTPTGPADLATVSDVVLTWTPVVGAKQYNVQVSANGDFTNNLVEGTVVVKGTQYSPAATYPNGGYYWRVSPVDTLGRQGSWSATRQFTRASESPSAPTNLVASTTQLSFSWDPVPNASAYEIQVDADGNFSIGAKACTTFHARFTAYERPGVQPSGAPDYPTNAPAVTNLCTPGPGAWFWRVRALDANPGKGVGQFGPWSSTQSVTVAYPAALPGTLTQVPGSAHTAPADCAVSCTPQADTPLLAWNAVAGARSYYVRIASDPNFTTEVQRYFVVGTELQPRESLPDNSASTSYYWWVQACSDLAGLVCVPDDQSTIAGNATSFRKLADPVELVSPVVSDPVPVVTDVVTLDWSSTYSTQPAATGVNSYRVQVANDLGFTSLVDDVTVDQTTYQAYLKTYPDSLYYWRVQAIDGSQLALSWSTPRSFVKKSSTPSGLAATRLDEASAVPVLSWDSNAYVSGYLVQIYSGTNPLFPGSAVKEATVQLPTYTIDTALPAGTYSWRVRRLDPSGNPGPWQEQTDALALPTFTVGVPVPVLITPTDGELVAGNGILFTWGPVKGATQYRLESSLTAGFATLIEGQDTVMTAWAPTAVYPNNKTVYWRVRSIDGNNKVLSTSAVQTLTKDAVGPVITIDVSGGPGSLQPSLPVTFNEGTFGITASTVKLTRTGSVAVTAGLTCFDAITTQVPCSGGDIRKVVLKPSAQVTPGETYTVTVTSGIADALGNNAVTTTKSFRALQSVEQNSPSVKYVGTWSTVATSVASGGSYAKATSTSASASWTFRGTSARVVFVAQKSAGRAKVYVDGVLRSTVDTYSSTATKKTFVFVVPTGTHTVKVVPAGSKSTVSSGTAIAVDGFSTS